MYYYDFQIAGDDLFTDLKVEISGLDRAYYKWSELPRDGSKLYWRVRISSESSLWTETRWFISANPVYYTLTVQVSPNKGGTVTRSPEPANGYYASYTEVTLTAIANSGYEFTRWDDENNSEYSTSSVINISMTSNRILVAVFTSTGEGSGGCSGNKIDDANTKITEYTGGCSSCKGENIKQFLADYLLLGIALMALAVIHRFDK